MEDAEIIELYWNRSEKAILKTAEKYGAYCMRIAMNILSNPQDAEECVNTVYLNVWNSIPPHRPRIFSAFVGKVARNVALNRLDAKNAKRRGGGETVLSFDELDECIPDDGQGADITEKIDAERLGELINGYLGTLTREARLAFVGRYFYFDSIKEIAKKLGTSEGNVKNYLYRARNGLKIYLKKEGIEF